MANKNFEVKHGLSVGGTERITSAGAGSFTDLTLSGDLNITGDVNSVSVTDLDVTDKTITLGKGQVESASGGSGIIIDGSAASFTWDETNDRWLANKKIACLEDLIVNANAGNDTSVELGAGTSQNHYSYIDLIGDSTYTDYGLRLIRNNGGANTSSGIHHRGTGNLFIRTEEDAPIIFLTKMNSGGAERMRITGTTGNVGIGTTDPTLEINTGSYFKPDSNGRFLTINGGANGSFINLESDTTTDDDQIGGIYWTRTEGQSDAHRQVAGIDAIQVAYAPNNILEGGTLRFFTKPSAAGTNTPRMVINSNGSVGIGTTSPIANLDVVRGGTTGLSSVNARTTLLLQNNNSAGTVLSINAPNTGYSGIFLGDPEQEAQGQIKQVHTDNTMQFVSSSGATEMTLKAGNLGIGTTSPSRILDVEVSSDNAIGSVVSGTSNIAGFVFGDTSADDQGGVLYDNSSDFLYFRTGGAERMRINSSGNLSLGTTSHVNLSGSTVEFTIGTTGDTANDGGGISFAHNTSTLNGYLLGQKQSLSLATYSTTPLLFLTNNTERMRIDSGGDLLIGTSTNLDVLSGTPKLQVGSGTGHSSIQFYSGTGSVGALYFGDGTSGTDRYPGYIEYRHNTNTMAFRVNGTDHVVFLSNGQISCKNITATDSAGNVSVGYGALNVVQANSGDANVAVGYEALEDVTTGSNNTGIGYRGAMNITSGNYNTALGTFTMYANTSGSRNTALGYQALYSASGNDHNTAVGNRALVAATNNGSCTAVGSMALEDCTENGHNNTAIGVRASYKTTSGQYNTSLGVDALEDNQTGQYNTACGSNALGNVAGSNNSGLGYSAGKSGSPGGQLGNVSNRIVLGNGDITHLYCEVSSISTSDERDKTDFTDLNIGLDFVKSLKPYTFRWDKRHKYVDWDKNPDTDLNSITNDGTHKDAQLDLGFKAQEVEALEVAAGYKKEDETNLVIDLTDDGTKYGIKYEKLVPILVKAIQELEARVKELEG